MVYNTQITLSEKSQLTKNVWEYKYIVPKDLVFEPGQFASIVVKPPLRRSYSILEVKNGLMTLIVDLSPGGPGSQFFANAKIGEGTTALLPLGVFKCNYSAPKQVFIATGTGLVPFIPMIDKLLQDNADNEIEFFLGTRTLADNKAYDSYFKKFLGYKNFKFYRCISQPEAYDEYTIEGRVTKVLPKKSEYVSDTQFYICGVNQMIFDMQDVLKGLGIPEGHVFFEKYG